MENLESIYLIIIAVVVFLNTVLTAIVSLLEGLKRQLREDHAIYKILSVLAKLIDLISANRKH